MSTQLLLALVFMVYLAWITYRRGIRGDGDDPGVSTSVESDTGYTSFVLSGSWYVTALVAVTAALLWPLPIEEPIIGAALAGLVVAHYIIEKREV